MLHDVVIWREAGMTHSGECFDCGRDTFLSPQEFYAITDGGGLRGGAAAPP